MKFVADRPFADPENAARKLVELASVDPYMVSIEFLRGAADPPNTPPA
jgi:hypothetical protein